MEQMMKTEILIEPLGYSRIGERVRRGGSTFLSNGDIELVLLIGLRIF
jgi:hypothetical protein